MVQNINSQVVYSPRNLPKNAQTNEKQMQLLAQNKTFDDWTELATCMMHICGYHA